MRDQFLESQANLFLSITQDAYGLSEFYEVSSPRFGDLLRKPTTIGRPFVNTEAKIVDEEGRIVPRNTRGELYLRGPGIFKEYLGQPELTQKAKTADGWLKTGSVFS